MSLRNIADYTIIRELGRGGMGAVFQALSPTGATVALKTITWPEAADPRARWEAIERFQREARAARALHHPNICQVLDCGASEDCLFIVMEFLDGETLRELIQSAGPLRPERAVQIVLAVCQALAYAHQRGVVHRDIKPGNIMVLRSGEVKLTDFGLAAIASETSVSRTGEMMGTLSYLSPEQVRGETVDARSDIFSLGATFHAMVTGRQAFPGDTPGAVMHQVLTADPALPDELPASIRAILRKCLRKDPQERFQSAQEMIASLSGAAAEVDGRPTAVLPRAEGELARRLRLRLSALPRALKWWPALLALVLVVVGAAVLPRMIRRDEQAKMRQVARPGEPLRMRLPPDLKPLQQGLVTTYLYGDTGQIAGLAVKPDGAVVVAVQDSSHVPAGVYLAGPGDSCDQSDAYGRPGNKLYLSPGGIAVHPDGTVLVADSKASTIWAIPARGARPVVLTDKLSNLSDVLVAPAGFAGPKVDAGDVLVCGSSSGESAQFGLYVVDPETREVSRLAGPPELRKRLLHAAFAPDGRLYAVEDTVARDACTIVTVTPEGKVARATYKFQWDPSPYRGPIALDTGTGDLYFAHRSTIYRLPAGSARFQKYAAGSQAITALAFDSPGRSLLVGLLNRDTGAGTVARIAAYPIEGRLLVSGWHRTKPASGEQEFAYLLSGSSAAQTPVVTPVPTGMSAGSRDLSPVAGDEVVYAAEFQSSPDTWDKRSSVWKSDLSGGNAARLGDPVAATGINCVPLWSPDGKKIAFLHCDPISGEKPCATGLDLWVMNADGTRPEPIGHPPRTERLGSESFPIISWDPRRGRPVFKYGTKGRSVMKSPDGKRTVGSSTKEGEVDGEPGVWRRLCIGDADGENEQVCLQWFVKDSDVAKHLSVLQKDPEDPDLRDDVREWVGPMHPTWSPSGDRVAFLAALPFDPAGDYYKFQVEVWVYELSTGILAKLTANEDPENGLSWRPGALPAGHADGQR